MWYLILGQLFSSVVKEYDFIETYRIGFGFIYVNPIDAIVYSSVIIAMLFGNRPTASPKNRIHPMLFVIIGLMLVGGVCGAVGAMVNNNWVEFSLRQGRDYFAWPVCIFAGYRLLPNPASAWKYMYVLVTAGILTAAMTITHFAQNTQGFEWSQDFNSLRTVEYVVPYCGLAAATLTYSMIYRPVRMMPNLLALILACFCMIGQFAPLARGEWLEGFFCIIVLFAVAPTSHRFVMMLKAVGMILFLIAALYGALQLASAAIHQDFGKTINNRLLSMLPGSDSKTKAWDSRVGSISQEIDIWKAHPIFGEGFGSQESEVQKGKIQNTAAYFHNGWSSLLATVGIFGFAGFMCMIGTLFVIGKRLTQSHWERGPCMMGAYGVAASVYLSILVLSSICWYSRLALVLGVLCGMILRLRDIQLTEITLAEHEPAYSVEEEIPSFHEALAPVNDAFF